MANFHQFRRHLGGVKEGRFSQLTTRQCNLCYLLAGRCAEYHLSLVAPPPGRGEPLPGGGQPPAQAGHLVDPRRLLVVDALAALAILLAQLAQLRRLRPVQLLAGDLAPPQPTWSGLGIGLGIGIGLGLGLGLAVDRE